MKFQNLSPPLQLFLRCFIFALSPLALIVISGLIVFLFNCDEIACKNIPKGLGMLQIFMVAIGVYGVFFTIPVAIVFFIFVSVVRAIPRTKTMPHKHKKLIRWIIEPLAKLSVSKRRKLIKTPDRPNF